MISLEEMFTAYEDCRKRKTSTFNEQLFEVDFMNKIVELWKEVNERRYQIGESITFIIKIPKPREIFAADFRDRVIHHFIMLELGPYLEKEFIEDNYNCRVGKGVLYGVERLAEKIKVSSENYTKKNLYVGRFDMKGFFMSIHKPTLWKMIETFILNKYKGNHLDDLLYLCRIVILHNPQFNCRRQSPVEFWKLLGKGKSLFQVDPDYGLPIGNLTSQCFANFFLNEFDKIMEAKFPLGYGRYVDDFYVMAETTEEIIEGQRFAKEYLEKNLKLTLHPHKVYIQHYTKGVKFIGSFIKNGRIYTGNDTIDRIYKKVNWFNSIEVTPENLVMIIRSMNSYFGLLSHTASFNIRKKIWEEKLDMKWKVMLRVNQKYLVVEPLPDIKELAIVKNCLKNGKTEDYFGFDPELLGESIE